MLNYKLLVVKLSITPPFYLLVLYFYARVFTPNFFRRSCRPLMVWFLIMIGCGVVRFGATLRDVSVSSTVSVSSWNNVILVAVAVAVAVAIVVVYSGGS